MGCAWLSLVLTDRCNAACDFCSLSCGPEGQQVMDEKLMLRVIHEAKLLGATIVEFTGGEPFLYPELLIAGARVAHEEKLQVAVTTNGFWGAWSIEKIRDMLKALKPDCVNVSTDFFHNQYVPLEYVKMVIQCCAKQNINFRLMVADMAGLHSAGRYIQSTGSELFSVLTRIYPVRRCGRALNLPEAWFLPDERTKNRLSVFYDGDVYACDPNEARDPAVCLGSALQTPLREIIGGFSDSAGKETKRDVQ